MSLARASQQVSGEVQRLSEILWGSEVKTDVFLRWTSGFTFSQNEPTALVQSEGGPCSVLASVQAHMLKHIVTTKQEDEDWRNVTSVEQDRLLVDAICEILAKAYGGLYSLVYFDDNGVGGEISCPLEHFHTYLQIIKFNNIEEVKAYYTEKIGTLKNLYGVLTFLYSVVFSRGLTMVEEEMNGSALPLIDSNHGYSSQVLTNLMITGCAVDNVFNNVCEIGGMCLLGIPRQSEIGFLTLLEHLRYCEVGSYLKKPCYPVWVLGSETHLSVLFSFDKRLTDVESKEDIARRVFNQYDTEGSGFIKTEHLKDVLEKLDLFSSEEYVKVMTDKLDPEKLGIVLINPFMEEFFPGKVDKTPDTFTLYHYNGQPRSNVDGKVVYRKGAAIMQESYVICINDSDELLTCLQTRWPNLDIQWDHQPSLN